LRLLIFAGKIYFLEKQAFALFSNFSFFLCEALWQFRLSILTIAIWMANRLQRLWYILAKQSHWELNFMYVAIEGVIGVGKTTLSALCPHRFFCDLLLEVFEENPFISTFIATAALCLPNANLLPDQPLPAAAYGLPEALAAGH
jgi:hypothetical protein